jgi:hypothetical protein
VLNQTDILQQEGVVGSAKLLSSVHFQPLLFITKIWRGKWGGILGLLLGISISISMFHLIRFKYQAELVVAPTQQDIGLSKSLSGLASIAGVSLPKGGATSPFALYLQVLQSRSVAEAIYKDEYLMRRMFPQRWNDEMRKWQQPKGLRTSLARLVTSLFIIDSERTEKPTVAEVQRFLSDRLNVVENRRDSMAHLYFANEDKEFTILFLTRVHEQADRILRERALKRTEVYIEYLDRQLSKTTVAELRETLSQASAEQQRARMVALSGLPFAAEPVGGISLSARPVQPNPFLVLVIGIIFSLLLALLLALSWSTVFKNRRAIVSDDS